MSGLLMDVPKHLCNLKYTIWEKMLDAIDYSESTLITVSYLKIEECKQFFVFEILIYIII